MATEDIRYRQSTQYRLWSFSPSQLADLRAKTNELATASISARLVNRNATAAAAAAAAGDASSAAATPPLPDFLSLADEHRLVTFYTVQLLHAANFCELPTDVRATAAIFFKRFYVTNSIMTYPPMTMITTALFFGAKAEGFYIRVGKIAEKFKGTTADEILAGEFLLCEGIRFAFDIRHPYRGLEGAVMELKRLPDLDENRIKDAHMRAREILKFSSLVTDAYFHYTPSQIMLAALSLADRGLAETLVDESFKLGDAAKGKPSTGKPGRGKKSEAERERIFGADVREKVLATVEGCREMLAREPPERDAEFEGEEAAQCKPLTRRLRKCRDPDRSDLVALQKARRERALNSADSDDERDGKKPKGSMESDGAVFGGPVGEGSRDAKRRKVGAVADPFGPPL